MYDMFPGGGGGVKVTGLYAPRGVEMHTNYL